MNTYRRVAGGPPATVRRNRPDPRLERSKRWKRVQPKDTPAASDSKEK